MTRWANAWASWATVAALSMSAVAHAQSPKPSGTAAAPDPEKEVVQKLFTEGAKAAAAGNWAQAEAAYAAAYRLKPLAQIAANLGHAELEQGKHAEAAQHLHQYLSDPSNTDDRDRVQAWFERAKAKVCTAVVSADVDGAEIQVDGALIGKTPLQRPVFLAPGKHVVEGRAGELYERQSIEGEAGTSREVKLVMKKPAETPTATPANAEAVKSPTGRTAVLVTGLAIGVAGLGLGIGAIYVGADKANQLAPCRKGDCGRSDSDLGAAEAERVALMNAGFFGFVAAGVAAVTSLGIGLAWTDSSSSRSPAASVRVSPAGNGVAVSGTF